MPDARPPPPDPYPNDPPPGPQAGEVLPAAAEEGVIRDYQADAQNRVNFLLSWIRPGILMMGAVGALVGLLHLVLPPKWHWLDEIQRWLTWLLLGGGGYALRGLINSKRAESAYDID